MIIVESKLEVADNSGAKKVKCIKVKGSTGIKVASIGSAIKVSIREAIPGAKVKKGDVTDAVIVRTKQPPSRKDAFSASFSSNAVVLINKQGDPIGTRIFGPVGRELREKGYIKIISLSPEVV